MFKIYAYIKCSNMCTSGNNCRRNSYSICTVNNRSSDTASDNRKTLLCIIFFVLLHVPTCNLLQILISVMLCYVTQCFEENKCCINLTFQCFKIPFIVYISDRLLCAYNILSILIQYNFSAVYGGDDQIVCFWSLTLSMHVGGYLHFRGAVCLLLQGGRIVLRIHFFCLKTIKPVLILSNRNIQCL
jgi:hypothetical protein